MKYYIWCDDDCANCTYNIDEARQWRDEFLKEGRDSYIVDADNNLID